MESVFFTRGISYHCEKDEEFTAFVHESVTRFLKGDWGSVVGEDKCLNDECPEVALGVYRMEYQMIWIKRDGETVTVLFPAEY